VSVRLEDLPDVLTPKELQMVLRCGKNQVYALLHSGEIPSIRTSPHRFKIPKAAVQQYLMRAAGR